MIFQTANCVVLGSTCEAQVRKDKGWRTVDKGIIAYEGFVLCLFIILHTTGLPFEFMHERGNHCTTKISKGLQYSKLLSPFELEGCIIYIQKIIIKDGSFFKTLRFTACSFFFFGSLFLLCLEIKCSAWNTHNIYETGKEK